jgi:hypothetical protein
MLHAPVVLDGLLRALRGDIERECFAFHFMPPRSHLSEQPADDEALTVDVVTRFRASQSRSGIRGGVYGVSRAVGHGFSLGRPTADKHPSNG